MYEDQIKWSLMFCYFDDEDRAPHPLVISRNNYKRVANLLNWKGHYALITNITRLCYEITKHGHEHKICFRCLTHIYTEESFARHKQLCTRKDFMSKLYVLLMPGSKKAQLKFIKNNFSTIAPFIIYANFESIIKPLGRQAKQKTYI